MADYTYDGAGYAAPASGKVASMANWLGAAASLALIVGVGVWGYRVMARDVSGVPIVMAMSGPMRVAPDDPGGTTADHQGLAVNNVAGNGSTEGPADRLVLAPVPAGLGAEDVAAGVIVTPPSELDVVPMAASLARQAQIMEIQPTDGLSEAVAEIDPIQALANQLAAGAAPLTSLAPGQNAPVVTMVDDAPVVKKVEETPAPSTIEAELAAATRQLPPGLQRSLRPQIRPTGLRTAALDVPNTPAVAVVSNDTVAIRELAAESLPAGTRLVQIGIFDSPDSARKEWARLDVPLGDYLNGKDRVIQKANRGGREFYRLRAHGFADLSDARRFCAAFMARNVDCIPLVTK
ncbi:SPOR domain-containing protein [Pelagimonas varians]|uniref:Sporulation related domain protein n=1 Tax=Pelagimonas varians TaxID=696760 RepID=A0A238K8R6_9RHOB|nr:SPOR domain-containing protein [Pelagimonas varians]PYG31634.1 sporulation related protein [Pelagimonas varians]SMX38887.1 Sporulation related domain protein [Pelagimonas varians]